MKKRQLAIAMIAALGWQGPVLAQSELEERIQRMEQQLRYLEGRVKSQDQVITEQERKLSEAGTQWWEGVTLSGLVEVEAMSSDNADINSATDNGDVSDIAVATVELGLEARLNDWTRASVVLLYEEDDTELDVDAATLTFGNPDASPLYLTVGRTVVPFGRFVTHMVSDPFTLEIGETYETTALVGFESDGLYGSAFLFNGDADEEGDDDTISNGGLNLGYAHEGDNGSFDVSVSYLSDLADTDALTDTVGGTVSDEVAAWSAYVAYARGPFTVLGEYLAASDRFDAGDLAFDGRGAKPSAWNVEAGYTFELAGKESTVAIGYQNTEEALGLELPEERLSVGLSVAMMENTAVSFEWARDEAYETADGGTGQDGDTVTAQLAVEF